MANPLIEDLLEPEQQAPPTTGNAYYDAWLKDQQKTAPPPFVSESGAPSRRLAIQPRQTAPPTKNDYLDAYLEDQRRSEARLQTRLSLTPTVDPKKAAEILPWAQTYALPSEIISRNYDHYQKLAKEDQVKALMATPGMAAWLGQQDDVTIGAIKDDLGHLTGIAGTVRAWSRGIPASWWDVGAGLWGMIGQLSDVTNQAQGDVRRAVAMFTNPQLVTTDQSIGFLAPKVDPLPELTRLSAFAEGAARAASVRADLVQGDLSHLSPTERAIAMSGRSIGQMIQLMPFGQVGVLAGFGLTTSGQEYQQYREQRPTESVYRAAGYATVQGAIEVLTEVMPLKYMEDIFKGKGFVDRVWRLYASEIGGEQAAAALQGLNTYYSIEANQGKTWDQFLQEQKGRQYEALVASVVTSTLMGGMSRLAAKATDHANRIAQQSKTIEHLPHLAQQALEASMAGKKVFIDLATFTEFFQSKGIDPAAMALKATGSTQAWDDAQQTHEPIELPLSGYFTHIGSKAEYNQLGQELRHHSPTAATAKEEATVAETLDAGVAEVPGTAVAPIAEGTTAAPRPIYDAALAEFTAKREATPENQQTTGGQVPVSVAKHYATLIEQGFQQLAKPLGLDPAKLYQAYGLKVTREASAGLRRAAAAKQLIDPETGQPFETTPTLLGRVFETARAAVAKVGAALGLPSVATPEAGSQLEQPAWHGSPHIFEQFSLHAIGTGEGAQAYGWGLYFASKKEVAEQYRNQLASQTYKIDGKELNREERDFYSTATAHGLAVWHLATDRASDKTTEGVRKGFDANFARDYEKSLEKYRGRVELVKEGRLYKVEIPEDADYLDWDKPLSQQSEKVLAALAALGVDSGAKQPPWIPHQITEADQAAKSYPSGQVGEWIVGQFNPDGSLRWYTGATFYSQESAQAFIVKTKRDTVAEQPAKGEEAYQLLAQAKGGTRAASEALASMGIAGLRYLDGMSRGRGEGSSNYVVFDDRLVQITEYYQTTKQTETPEFRAWFQDSKVVDAEGQPLVVYHGTPSGGFTEFTRKGARDRGWLGGAFYFTESLQVADWFTAKRTADKGVSQVKPEVYPVYLSIQNPLDIRQLNVDEFRAHVDAARASRQREPLSDEQWAGVREAVREFSGTEENLILAAKAFNDVVGDLATYAEAAGYDGLYATGVEGGTWAAFKPEQIKHAEKNRGTFDPNDPNILYSAADGEARAALRIDDATLARTLVLFQSADRSSSLHELGHLFLDVFADVASEITQRDPATLTPEAIRQRDDFQQFLTWSGFTGSIQDWQALSVDEKRPHHEQFAEAWESYLRSGKAPSKALRGAFAAFRRWLMKLASFLQTRVEFSPEMKEVVDRMLASDEAIAEVLNESQAQPMIQTAEQAAAMGLTKEQYAAYQTAIENLPLEAQQALDAQLFTELAREDTAEWKARRAELHAVVTADVHAEKVYQALAAMTRGTTPAGETIGPPMPINRQALVALGLDVTRLPKGVTTTEGGLTPDQAAEAFGYDSPAALVAAVEAAEPMGRKIARETKARMLEDQGSMLLDGRLKPEAQAAVVNDSAETAVHTELSALHAQARKVSPARAVRTGIPSLDFFRREAAARLKRMVVGKINPQTFFVTARQQSKIALDEGVRGNVEAAIAVKNRELLNMALFRQSMALQKEVDKRVAFAKKQASGTQQAKFGLVGDDFQDNINALLAKYQLAPIAALAKGARQADLAAFEKKLLATPLPADLPRALQVIPPEDYRKLTVQEFLDITDGLTQIAHLALKENRAIKIANKAVLDDIRRDFAAHIALKTPPKSGRVHEVSEADKRRIRVASWFATHTKLSQFFYELDGSETGGMAFDLFGRPLNEADDFKRERLEQEAKRYAAIIAAHYTRTERGQFTQKMLIPGTNFSLSKEARLAIVLNMGNEGNYSRLQTDPSRQYSEWELKQILDTLDARDVKFVQATWDYLESFWPEVAAKEQRLTGLEPVKVQARTVETRHGTLRGGYYPIAYDANLSARQTQFDIAEDGKLTAAAGYGRMMTERGHLEERAKTTSMPLILELTVVGQHVDQVVHDLAFHEVLIDVSRVLNSRDVENAISASHGPLKYTQIVAAVRDIAQGYIPARDPIDKVFSWMKTGSQIAAMAYNAWTAAQQPLGNANTLGVLGAGNYHYYFKGLKRFGDNAQAQEGTLAWIRSNSALMRQREKNLNQEQSDLREAFRSQSGWFNKAILTVTGDRLTAQHLADSFMWHIGKAQLLADIPAWLAGYEMAMDKMRQQGPAAIDEQKAFALADQLVLDSQGGGSIKDMSQIQRGGPVLRAWLTFYSYSNLVFNQTRRIAGRTDWADPSQVTKAMSDLSLVYIAPAIGTTILAAITKGIWPGDDDDEDESKVDDWVWAIASESMGTAMGTMAIARDLSTVTKQLLTDDSSVRGVEGPAGTRILTELGKAAIQAEQGEVDEGLVKALNNVAGTVFRYPAVQAQRTANGFAAIIDGRTKNPLALIFGAPKEGAR